MVWQIQLVMSQVKKEEKKKRKALDWMDSDSDESTRWDADNDDDDGGGYSRCASFQLLALPMFVKDFSTRSGRVFTNWH